jgi:DNA-binding NarL/FixJ family response regulator
MKPWIGVEVRLESCLGQALRARIAAEPGFRLMDEGADVVLLHAVGRASALPFFPGGGRRPAALLLTTGTAEAIAAAVTAGITALFVLGDPWDELFEGIERAAAGRPFCSASLQRLLLQRAAELPARDGVPDRALLTRREWEIVELAARFVPNREIAAALFIELATVKTHLRHAWRKLEVRNRDDLLRRYPGLSQRAP